MKTHSLALGGFWDRAIALYRIQAWGKKAKSFSIVALKRYHYGGFTKFNNMFDIRVDYYSNKNEGKYQMPAKINRMNNNRIKITKNKP